MVAVGCFHPAIDATAGERERGTWETLMTVAARRPSLVAGKYLYVATMGAVAGLLNVAAMTLSMNAILAPLMREEGVTFEFDFPLRAVPVLAAGTILLALFVAAGMMILASFARTFREGQSLVSPFYIVIILPVLFLQDEGTAFTARLAVIPVANVLMVFREAIMGRFDLPLIGLSLLVEAVAVGLCLWLATSILRVEDIMAGSYSGSLLKFVRERLRGRTARGASPGGGSGE
jgi:sodium transport system permease protein